VEIFLRTVLVGLVTGSVYALASVGLVLTYRTSGVLNFGYGALALFTTFIHWGLTVAWGLPVWISALIVIFIVAPVIGFALEEAVFSRIREQPIVIGIIATVGLWVLLQGMVFLIWGAETRTVPSLFPEGTVPLPGGARVGIDQLAVLAVAAGAAGVLAFLLRFTRLGISFRAVVDNRSLAGLMAVRTNMISGLAWGIGTSFAALMGILLAPRLFLDPNFLPPFIIAFVLGSAMVGYLRSLPLAYAGGLLLGLIQALIVQYGAPGGIVAEMRHAAPFLIMTGFVLGAPRALRIAASGASFIVRTREIAEHSRSRVSRATGPALFLALALVPVVASSSISWRLAVTKGLVFAVISLSFVVLTGFSGQISLGHTAFMGISTFTTAHLVADLGMPVWLAFAAGALAAVPAGVLIGLIAVRLHGLFLALMTLAFAFMAHEMFFTETFVSGPEGRLALPRPPGAEGDTAFYLMILAILAIFIVVAANLRTGRTGRVLAALRDSETGGRALGINVVKYKVVVFGLSAFMAGVGGILVGMSAGQVARLDFIPFYSLIYLTVAVIGGIFHSGGAVTAGLFFGLFPQVFRNVEFMLDAQLIFFGLGATIALAKNPAGMYGELRRAGLSILRIASRRRPVPQPVAGGQQ
jgi:branched-subunit amino acid ABC-type transport system permease component